MNLIFFDRETKGFNLSQIDSFMEGKDQQYIQNLKEFYSYQTRNFANSGDTFIRSLWNKVVADLPGVIYAQGNGNEIDGSILNIVRVFEAIFQLDLGKELELQIGQNESFMQAAKERFIRCFKLLFESLNPQKLQCEITLPQLYTISYATPAGMINNNVAGDSNFTISNPYDKESYAFTLKIIQGHTEIDTITINQEMPENVNIKWSHIIPILNNFTKIDYAASFVLHSIEEEKSFASFFPNGYENKHLSTTYDLFYRHLNDTNNKLSCLETLNNTLKKGLISPETSNLIIKNIMSNYLWNDQNAVGLLSKKLLQEASWIPLFKELIKNNIIKIHVTNNESFNLSEYPSLKAIHFYKCTQSQFFEGLAQNVEELFLNQSSFKSLNFSQFPALKKVDILYCSQLERLEESAEKLESLTIKKSILNEIPFINLPTLKELTIEDSDAKVILEKIETNIEQLETLSIKKTNIKKLDIAFFPRLKTLILFENAQSTNIEGNSTDLETLHISVGGYNYCLKKLNIEQFPNLKTLILRNYFGKIEGESKELQTLILHQSTNKFNFSQFPVLKNLTYTAYLPQIKAKKEKEEESKHSDIKAETIESLDISKIYDKTSVDVSYCKNLKQLSIKEFRTLEKLFISKEQSIALKEQLAKIVTEINLEKIKDMKEYRIQSMLDQGKLKYLEIIVKP